MLVTPTLHCIRNNKIKSIKKTINYIVNLLLMIVVLAASSSNLSYYLIFKINQDFIAQNLCIERDNPESTCSGCCQLESALENTDTDNSTATIVKFPELSLFGVIIQQNKTPLDWYRIIHNSLYNLVIVNIFNIPESPPPELI